MSFLKNITSKDLNQSKNTIKNLITSVNTEQFLELCQKSEFIFPFLKDRIIKDFVKLVNKEDLKAVFEFSKIYCSDFEEIVVNSWLKFASEDLTDEILTLFDKGTKEQKAYCALYFSRIKDPLALEYLNKFALCDFEPLKINCAKALRAFGDIEALNKAKEVVLKSSDDFEIINAYGFINAYGTEESIKFVLDNCFKSPFLSTIISNLMDFSGFYQIKEIASKKTLTRVFQTLIEAYPEDISLNTLEFYEIYDFVQYIVENKTPYENNVLLMTKNKFIEFFENDIYSFDLDKNAKNELKRITDYLKTLDTVFDEKELEAYDTQPYSYALALDIVKEFKMGEHISKIAEILNTKLSDLKLISKSALVLNDLGQSGLIDKKITDNIDDENIKSLIMSL